MTYLTRRSCRESCSANRKPSVTLGRQSVIFWRAASFLGSLRSNPSSVRPISEPNYLSVPVAATTAPESSGYRIIEHALNSFGFLEQKN